MGYLSTLQVTRTELNDIYNPDILSQVASTKTADFKTGIETTSLMQDNMLSYNPFYGWMEESYLWSFAGTTTTSTRMTPNAVSSMLISYRYQQDVSRGPYSYSRPHNSVLTVLASTGGFAMMFWLIINFLIAPAVYVSFLHTAGTCFV